MAEHVEAIAKLKELGAGVHIFCPRTNDGGNVDEEQAKEEAKQRRELFFSALPLLAYDGEQCSQYHQWIYNTLDSALGKCEACIRQYYLSKVDFKQKLVEDYEDDEVQQFLQIIARKDISRIQSGLDAVVARLEPLPVEKRGPKVLDNKQLFALYETLHCDSFYTNKTLLEKHFDKPFSLVQTHKELKIKEVLPAVTKFLFSSNTYHLNWAVKTWQRLERPPTDEEWDWAVKDIILHEIQDLDRTKDLQKFWSGLKVICDTLTKDQIQLKLFDLGFNVPKWCLDHLSKPNATPRVAAVLSVIWQKAPDAFWTALSSISPVTVAEQFFGNKSFDSFLAAQANAEDQIGQDDVLSWIIPFLEGLRPDNRPSSSRTIAYQLMHRVKSDITSAKVKQLCFSWCVKVLVKTVVAFSENEAVRTAASRPVVSELLTTISTHLPAILDFQLIGTEEEKKEVTEQITTLVRNSLALECLTLKADYEAISNDTAKGASSFHTPDLWRTVNRHLSADRQDLSSAFLYSTMGIVGLEKFPIKSDTPLKTEKESFNASFGKVEDLLSQCVDHIGEFPAEHLDPLFGHQNTNMALIALLFSGNEDIYASTVELIKNVSSESGKVEALSHVMQAFFDHTLYSVCWIFRRMSHLVPFSPIPRLLQTTKNIIEILCDSTGLLRTKTTTKREREALQAFWSYTWLILTTIFRRMEKWSTEISDKPLMTEVCRNTMQLAQELFGHYYLFVKILDQGKQREGGPGVAKLLLNTDTASSSGSPPKALDSMVKWLRLRDPYLAETLVDLIVNMLKRLKEYGTEILADGYALTFVEEVAIGTTAKGKGTKTILNDNQKAGLIRALEQYTGKQIVQVSKAQAKKQQQRLDAWTSSHNKSSAEVITLDDNDDLAEIKQHDAKEYKEADLLRRQALLEEKKEKRAQIAKKGSVPAKAPVLSLAEQAKKKSDAALAFLEDRKRQTAAREAKRAEMIAREKRRLGGDLTANAGSGLRGLGIEDKDHSTPRSDLMVSSDSDSESSSDDELFGSSSKNAAVTLPSRPGRAVPIPTKKIKQTRSAKDMRARLSPDLTGLHKIILGWDYFSKSETPPNSTQEDYTLVSNSFKSVQDYQKTFEPLLILEGWQSFRTAREDGTFKPFAMKVASSMIVDHFFEITSTFTMQEGRELSIGSSDVLLLSKGSRPHAEPTEPHCLARVKEITRKRGELQVVYRVNSANNPMRQHLNDKAEIFAISILSLTPLEREYGALMALQYYDLADEIIRAKPSPLLKYKDEEVRDIQFTHNLNIAQAKAVKSAVDNDAFTLVQGPPGSGKTKTITAILSETITGMARMNSSYRLQGSTAPPPSNKKILVAAPSNAAVDELVMRFKDGIRISGHQTQKINVVRLGRSEAINAAVKDVTLEELVSARLAETLGGNSNPKEDIHAVMMEHKKASDEMVQLRQRMDALRAKGEKVSDADDQLHEALKRRKTQLGGQIDKMRETQNSASRDADIKKRQIQQEILDNAHVLCATLSGSGHEIFQGLNVEFETVIIDEAAQSIELSALIPLKYGCSKCILVGDPKQLPPTVLSRQAAKYQYEQSLFARMEKNHQRDIHLLDTQYRMHPEISAFPSKTFYDSRLRDGGDMARLRARPWHKSQIFAPYRFFDVEGMSRSAPKGRSLVNEAEIDAALAMYDRLVTDVPKYSFYGKIGIITPYKGQLNALKQRFNMRYGEGILNAIDFNTTDAFQGRESEIIIFSCVRASTQGIGFLNDVRRMNVGLTRAKCSLWVLGNSKSLEQGEFWRKLIQDAQARNLYTDDDLMKLLSRPLLSADMMKDDIDMMDDMNEPNSTDLAGIQNMAVTANPSSEKSRPVTGSPASDIPLRPSRQHSETPSAPQANGSGVDTQPPSTPSSGYSTPIGFRPEMTQKQNSTNATSISGATNVAVVGASKDSGHQQVVRKPTNTGVNGPSGGRFGLNSKVNCNICGSDQHFSHNCDNDKAREASLGTCIRCGKPGHQRNACRASRCFTCGEIGHVEAACKADTRRRLAPEVRREVERQEADHQRALQRYKEARAKKQLGEHGATIPEVKAGDSSGNEGKRKRSGSQDGGGSSTKLPRTGEAAATSAGQRVPTGPSMMAGGLHMRNGTPTGPRGQPLIRKKNRDENSLFAKKR